MYSTLGNSTVPAFGSSLLSVNAGSTLALPFYSTTSGSAAVTQLSGSFKQIVVGINGSAPGYVSFDGGVTFCPIPIANGQSIVMKDYVLPSPTSIVVGAPSGGSTVTGILAWAH